MLVMPTDTLMAVMTREPKTKIPNMTQITNSYWDLVMTTDTTMTMMTRKKKTKVPKVTQMNIPAFTRLCYNSYIDIRVYMYVCVKRRMEQKASQGDRKWRNRENEGKIDHDCTCTSHAIMSKLTCQL